jgi:hypothetical protein
VPRPQFKAVYATFSPTVNILLGMVVTFISKLKKKKKWERKKEKVVTLKTYSFFLTVSVAQLSVRVIFVMIYFLFRYVDLCSSRSSFFLFENERVTKYNRGYAWSSPLYHHMSHTWRNKSESFFVVIQTDGVRAGLERTYVGIIVIHI